MFKSHRKPVEITAPTPDITFHYPPPAHLLTATAQEQQPSKPPVQRYGSHPTEQDSARYHQSKEDKKKKFSIFKKKKKHDADSSRRAATRTPDASRRKELTLSYPDTAPLARRPHSSASNRDDLQRRGSERSIKSSEFLDDEDEVDTVQTDYPRYSLNKHHPPASFKPPPPPPPASFNQLPPPYKTPNSSSIPPPPPPSSYKLPTLSPGSIKPPPYVNDQIGDGGYDSLEKYSDISSRPRSASMRVEKGVKKDGVTVPQRPAPPPPPGRQPKSELTTPTSNPPAVESVSATPLPMVPGLVGIKNHGNTCFLNAILQCLSNTEQFLYYLLSEQCRRDLSSLKRKKKKRGNNSLPGGNAQTVATPTFTGQEDGMMAPDSPGAVIDTLIFLIKSLWNGQYEGRVSAVFKEVLGLWAEQYRGRNQHDAQEFLLWLLGYLHDNLNMAQQQQYSKTPPPGALSDKEDTTHSSTNSFVYNLFGGEYRSTLHCPECGNDSNTFDPYLCISLSVPRRGTRPVYVTMARRHQNTTKLMQFGLSVKVTATVQDLQRQLAIESRTLPHYLVIGDMREDGLHRFYHSGEPVALIQEDAALYAFEVTPYKGASEFAVPPLPVMEQRQETIYIILQNSVGQGEYSKRFGSPLCLRVWRDFTYSQLQSVVFKSIRKYLHEGVNPEVVCRDYIFFKCRVLDGLQGQEYLDPYCPTPLQTPTVEKALSLSKIWGYELHIKIVAEWEQWVKDCVCTEIPETKPLVHESVQLVQDHYAVPLEATLDDCLQWHTQDEKLEDEDSWTCPQCRHPQTGAKKKITFSSLPDVLVIHLKRFEQDEYTQSKLNTLVNFPVTGLDMTPYVSRTDPSAVLRPNSALTYHSHLKISNGTGPDPKSMTLPSNKSVHFKPEGPQKSSSSKKFLVFKKNKKSKKAISPPTESETSTSILSNRNQPNNIYDLYAICNHHGNMNHGHYIAYCLNPVNNQWYVYDDHHVLQIRDKEQLISQNAYVLFYVRRAGRERWLKSLPTQQQSKVHWINQLVSRYQLNFTTLPNLDHTLFSPQRQGSVTSAQTMSTASGVSPDNIFFPSHGPQMSAPELAPPSYHHHHYRQFSAGSSGGPMSPPMSSVGIPAYTPSLPSPSVASVPLSSGGSYFSQPFQTPPSSASYFTKRVGSFHGTSHHHVPPHLSPHHSHPHSTDFHSATRV